jgi:hypothetical protein
MLKIFLIAVGQILVIGAVLALVLVILGHGPWSRWLAPILLVAPVYGIVTVIRRSRNTSTGPLAERGKS